MLNPADSEQSLELAIDAALCDDRKTLTFAVLNPADSEQSLELAIDGAKLANQGHLWRMAPARVTAKNTAGKSPK